MQSIRTLLVGTRHAHSHGYATTLGATPAFDVVGYVDPEAESQSPKPPGEAGAAWAGFSRLEEAIDSVGPECALVFAPNNRATTYARRLVEAGVHVYCEKPGGRTSDEVLSVSEAAGKRDLVSVVGYTWRYNPAANEARRIIDSGLIGDLWSVEARMITSRVAARGAGDWIFASGVSGGGILHWLGCHWIDLIRYISGREFQSVSASCGNPSGQPIDVEEVASVGFLLDGGVVGSLHAGYVLPSGYDTYFAFRGSLGYVVWQPQGLQLTAFSEHPQWRGQPKRTLQFETAAVPGYGADGQSLLLDWHAAIRDPDRRPVRVDLKHAATTLRVIESIYEASARSVRVGPRS